MAVNPRGAFAPWAPATLETLPCIPPAALSPLAQLTAGLPALTFDYGGGIGAVSSGGSTGDNSVGGAAQRSGPQGGGANQNATPAGGWALPDGRLRVGTHLPLLARRYRYLSTIGEGASAQVLLAQDALRPGSAPVVLKVLKRQLTFAGQKEARALRFLGAAAPAAARHIVSLRAVFSFKSHFVLVLDRLHGSLLDYLVAAAAAPKGTRLAALRKIAQQLLVALDAMHACGLVHADLKPDNILMTRPPGQPGVGVRIADFGSCFAAAGVDTGRLSFEMQTLPYRAPEAVTGRQAVGTAADMWSLGCTLAELALQRPLFPAHTPVELLRQIEAALRPDSAAAAAGALSAVPGASQQPPGAAAANPSGRLSPQPGRLAGWHTAAPPLLRELAALDRNLADLVAQLLATDPAARLPAAAALRHAFLQPISPAAWLARREAAAATATVSAAAAQARQQQHGRRQPEQHVVTRAVPHRPPPTLHTPVQDSNGDAVPVKLEPGKDPAAAAADVIAAVVRGAAPNGTSAQPLGAAQAGTATAAAGCGFRAAHGLTSSCGQQRQSLPSLPALGHSPGSAARPGGGAAARPSSLQDGLGAAPRQLPPVTPAAAVTLRHGETAVPPQHAAAPATAPMPAVPRSGAVSDCSCSPPPPPLQQQQQQPASPVGMPAAAPPAIGLPLVSEQTAAAAVLRPHAARQSLLQELQARLEPVQPPQPPNMQSMSQQQQERQRPHPQLQVQPQSQPQLPQHRQAELLARQPQQPQPPEPDVTANGSPQPATPGPRLEAVLAAAHYASPADTGGAAAALPQQQSPHLRLERRRSSPEDEGSPGSTWLQLGALVDELSPPEPGRQHKSRQELNVAGAAVVASAVAAGSAETPEAPALSAAGGRQHDSIAAAQPDAMSSPAAGAPPDGESPPQQGHSRPADRQQHAQGTASGQEQLSSSQPPPRQAGDRSRKRKQLHPTAAVGSRVEAPSPPPLPAAPLSPARRRKQRAPTQHPKSAAGSQEAMAVSTTSQPLEAAGSMPQAPDDATKPSAAIPAGGRCKGSGSSPAVSQPAPPVTGGQAPAEPASRPGSAKRGMQRPQAGSMAAGLAPGSAPRSLRERQPAGTPKKPWWEA